MNTTPYSVLESPADHDRAMIAQTTLIREWVGEHQEYHHSTGGSDRSQPTMTATPLEATTPDVSDEEKIRVIEAHYRACWACIQIGAYHHCRHYLEHAKDRRIDNSRINPAAVLVTLGANQVAFPNRGPQKVSPIELLLLEAFWRAGLGPLQQYGIAGYIVDFAFPLARLVVEADGAAYHTDHERERVRDEAIRRQGWHIVHFTGQRIYQDADGCVTQVYRLARTSLV